MKKLVFSILFSFCVLAFANAQSNAIGVRQQFNVIGSEYSFNASLQLGISSLNRVEFGLGFDTYPAFCASAVYQWVFDLSQLEPGFNWYTGVGGGFLAYGEKLYPYNKGGANIGVLGILGMEYNFDFPLQVSVDFCPGFYVGSEPRKNFEFSIGISARYRF